MKLFFIGIGLQIEKTIITFLKPLGITFQFSQVMIVMGTLEKPTYKEWCMGTAFLLLGGGLIKVGKGFQEKFINKA